MMGGLRFRSLTLILATMLVLACRPVVPSSPAGPTTTDLPPTEAPTEIPLPTLTAAMPPSAYATRDAARGTAIAAGVRSPEGTCPPVPTATPEASPPPPTLASP